MRVVNNGCADVCRKWLWSRCGGSGVDTGTRSREQYDQLCLRHFNVESSSSVFSAAARPSTAAVVVAAPTAAATPDMM